ncbi:aminotransferase class I/II-fold pyridoxal phosphate-dependent enzyme [Brevibacillus fluminis]|uniref:Aminotransferase class I/II-fold pyridoxal phosphate-dependent enzyme n=1 Tax=Brevibacillus fluminis TaxID=511487 RepID=A0A3M8D9D7_9BACL|nr:GntG family PLP-dependent aldolase [Brevibacillus fluminis]RNB84652.1 aminotransferase class I/II-fold pyridoxal phosphate-dependent enzyme [Brevibacillus fluminis]
MTIKIDLYSDTITQPSSQMRMFMSNAQVGDEQKGEDPTVNELEKRVVALLNKPAALFLPSATMANQIALKTHSNPGDEIIAEFNSHVLHYEVGGPAFHSGVMVHGINGTRGCFTSEQAKAAIRPKSVYMPNTRLIWVENTNNLAGGTIWTLEDLSDISDLAKEHGLAVHMDGARLLNAVVASGIPAHVFTAHADTVTLCFSKGLGCPAGAMLAGSAEFIARARKYKHLFGGAMRQTGMIASSALFALEHNINRLEQDHHNARRLANGLAYIPGLVINPDAVETNIVFFECQPGLDEAKFYERCLEKGLRFSHLYRRLRAVTHLDVTQTDIDHAIGIAKEVCEEMRAAAGIA